jgi:hypothetical protein
MAAMQAPVVQSQAGQMNKGPVGAQNAQPGLATTGPATIGQNAPGDGRAAGAQVAVTRNQELSLVPAVAATENPAADTNASVFGPQVARLPVELDVSIPLRDFRVRDLLSLESGRLIESQWSSGVDLPVAAGQVLLAWSEFEVIETQLVVRLTRLA